MQKNEDNGINDIAPGNAGSENTLPENTDELSPGDIVYIKRNIREDISAAINVMIIIFAATGTGIMIDQPGNSGVFSTTGLANLKYYTVLSNELCLIVAVIWTVFYVFDKRSFTLLKLIASSAVSLTFVIVSCFLGPLYPDLDMYAGGNRYFHLIVPILGMLDFILLETKGKVPFKYTFIAALTSLIYGSVYLGNIFINGMGGEWPDTNDWYGFLNWGLPAALLIFLVIVICNFAIACVLRWINILINKERSRQ